MRELFPILILRGKWHVQKRNIKPGDVVLIKDSNPLGGAGKLVVIVIMIITTTLIIVTIIMILTVT